MTQRARLTPAVSCLDFIFSSVPLPSASIFFFSNETHGGVAAYVTSISSASCLTRIARSEARISEREHQCLLDVTPTDQRF
jgi:hypothetical protein